MLAGTFGFEHELSRKQSTARSSESVLRSSSSEDDDRDRARPQQREVEIARIATGQTERSDMETGRINHAGFFGYEGMMEMSASSTPEIAVPARRRMLPASRQSRQSTDSATTMRPLFGSTPENLGDALADQIDRSAPASRGSNSHVGMGSLAKSPYRSPHKSPYKSPHKSPHKSPGGKVAWGTSSDAAQWREPSTPDRARLRATIPDRDVSNTREFVHPPTLSDSCSPQKHANATVHQELPARPALAPTKAINVIGVNHSQDRLPCSSERHCKSDREQEDFPPRRLGHKDVPASLAVQSTQYGQASAVLESLESSKFQKLKAVRTLGQLYSAGMFEARQELLRAVDCDAKMVRVAAVHELMAAPVASHSLGMDHRIELGRVLTKILDERDDGSGLGVSGF